MKLISCEECGCVLDTARIYKPDMWYDDQESIIEANSCWSRLLDDFVECITCPCCKTKIMYATGDLG